MNEAVAGLSPVGTPVSASPADEMSRQETHPAQTRSEPPHCCDSAVTAGAIEATVWGWGGGRLETVARIQLNTWNLM